MKKSEIELTSAQEKTIKQAVIEMNKIKRKIAGLIVDLGGTYQDRRRIALDVAGSTLIQAIDELKLVPEIAEDYEETFMDKIVGRKPKKIPGR